LKGKTDGEHKKILDELLFKNWCVYVFAQMCAEGMIFIATSKYNNETMKVENVEEEEEEGRK
jgi:hypothetical protein